jgi:hypothetical protein
MRIAVTPLVRLTYHSAAAVCLSGKHGGKTARRRRNRASISQSTREFEHAEYRRQADPADAINRACWASREIPIG